MSGIPAERQEFAKRLATVLRRLDRRGETDAILEAIKEDRRDLNRWSRGEKMPADTLLALISELDEADANHLLRGTGYIVKREEAQENADIFVAIAAASDWAADAAERYSDGVHCHADKAALARKARENVVPIFKRVAGGGE